MVTKHCPLTLAIYDQAMTLVYAVDAVLFPKTFDHNYRVFHLADSAGKGPQDGYCCEMDLDKMLVSVVYLTKVES
jgi:hypothetical protein